jgi:hypothetical protein
MANIPTYGCTRCQTPTPRNELTVKKAVFTEMGEGPSTLRSRVVDWLCGMCLKEDHDFNREKFSPPRMVNQLVVVSPE